MPRRSSLALVCTSCLLAVFLFLDPGRSFAQTAGPVPSPWVSADIGSPVPAGGATYSQGQFVVAGGGADIAGTSDQFQFVYQQITGDVDLMASVDQFTSADAWSKVGVMIRAELTPDSAHAFALVSGSNGLAFQARSQRGNASVLAGSAAGTAPRWVRVVRTGTTVTGYSSTDGATWAKLGSATIALGDAADGGQAVASHDSAARAAATLSHVVAASLALPPGQTAVDIGSPAIAGSSSYADGVYTIGAAGADIGGASDQFRFIYQPITGDVDVVARVSSLQRVRWSSKAGIMVRESLQPDARNAMALLTAAKGYAFQWRLDQGGTTDSTPAGGGTAPGWLRLVRTGHTFEAFRSNDGRTWTSMGIETVAMASTVYVGLAVTSHSVTRSTTATIDHVTLHQSSAAPNQMPAVTLTAPAAGATYSAPADIHASATASDPENRLSRVEFYANATRIGSVSAAPYTVTWSGVPTGTYSITAVAYDLDGGSATSAAVTVTVGTANQPPIVTLTSPTNGATFVAPTTVTLAASASDPEGRLAKVEFYVGTTLVAADTAAPFAASWSATAAGTYAVKAVAYDSNGGVATSAISTITIATGSRFVVFQASADHATLVNGYRLDVFGNGADPATATPVASSDLGKPAPDPTTNDITVDRTTFFTSLPAGTYVATVSAIGSSGTSRSAPTTFVR